MYTINLRYFEIVEYKYIYIFTLAKNNKKFFNKKLSKFYKSTFSGFFRSLNRARKPHPLAICSPDIP